MGIKAKIDHTEYSGIETIEVGGKSITLEETYSGSKAISANGTYDVSGYAEAVVDVPAEGITPSGTKEITENGTYDVTNYESATVNVAQETEGYSVDDVCNGILGKQLFYNEAIVTNVTEVREYAFAGVGASKVTANSATRFKKGVAKENTKMTELVAPNVTYIGTEAFYGCTALTKADYPLCETLYGGDTFYGCTKLAEVNLPKAKTVKQQTFLNCKALTSISLPALTSLGNADSKIFSGCTNLTNVELPSLASAITQDMFNGCTSLAEIELPCVTSIGNTAFSECTALEKVDLGESCTALSGTNIFKNCMSLTTLILRCPTMVTATIGVFSGATQAKTVYVPSDLISTYEANSAWATLKTSCGVTFSAIEGSEYE